MATTLPLATADSAVGRSALRKASLRLIPLIALGYGCAYIDRVNISFASLQMNRDLHFSATTYGIGAGLFFVSYAACEIPSNLALVRFGACRWLARIMITWGLIAVFMLFVRTPLQFYALRFLLGVAEAGFFPGILFYLMQWFPAELRARTVSRFYIAVPLSSACMGAVAGALLNLNGHLGLAGWQWLFLVEGLPAVLLGLCFLLLLPDSPATAKWLTAAERSWIMDRLETERTAGTHAGHSLGKALRDPSVWQMGILFLLVLGSSYALTFSAPAILQQAGHFSTTIVGYIIAGFNLLACVAMILNSSHSDRTRERHLHILLPLLVMGLGFVACGLTNQPFVLIAAMSLLTIAFYAMQGPLWSLLPGFAGRSAAGAIAAINTIGILGGFLGPYAMGVAKDLTGTYHRGLLLLCLPSFIAAGMVLQLRRAAARRPAVPSP